MIFNKYDVFAYNCGNFRWYVDTIVPIVHIYVLVLEIFRFFTHSKVSNSK